jgi:hypothetical protein
MAVSPPTLRREYQDPRQLLAHAVGGAGDPLEAVAMLQALLRELVDARERVLGPDHPHTARARRDLAALQKPMA